MRFLIAVMLAGQCAFLYGKQPQDSLTSSNKNRISPGFNYHLQLSHIDVSPVLTIPVSSRVQAGGGLNYLYYYRNSERVNESSYGVNLFTRIFPFKNIFVHGEYLYMNVPYRNKLIYEFNRVYVANVMVGAGYRQPFSDRIEGYFTVMVDVTHSENSPYEDKILFKAGFTF